MTKHEIIPYIKHIRDAIRNIESFINNLLKENFLNDKLRQDAIVRELEIIGEATKNIPEDFRKKYPKIEWRKMAGTRDRVIHAYFEVDLDLVWRIVKEDLPKLKKQIQEVLKKEEQKLSDMTKKWKMTEKKTEKIKKSLEKGWNNHNIK